MSRSMVGLHKARCLCLCSVQSLFLMVPPSNHKNKAVAALVAGFVLLVVIWAGKFKIRPRHRRSPLQFLRLSPTMMPLVTGEGADSGTLCSCGLYGLSSDPGNRAGANGKVGGHHSGWARRGLADWPIRNTGGRHRRCGSTSWSRSCRRNLCGSGFSSGYDAGMVWKKIECGSVEQDRRVP